MRVLAGQMSVRSHGELLYISRAYKPLYCVLYSEAICECIYTAIHRKYFLGRAESEADYRPKTNVLAAAEDATFSHNYKSCKLQIAQQMEN